MKKLLYWIADGRLLWSSQYLTEEDAINKAKLTQELSNGTLWLVQADTQPDCPKADSFKHISS